MRLSLRTLGMIIGLIGAAVGFIVVLLYSIFHLLGRIAGIAPDSSHFLLGLLATIAAIVGALFAVPSGVIGAVLLLAATVGFFFATGWWGILPALFLVPAAVLAFSNRIFGSRQRTAAS